MHQKDLLQLGLVMSGLLCKHCKTIPDLGTSAAARARRFVTPFEDMGLFVWENLLNIVRQVLCGSVRL